MPLFNAETERLLLADSSDVELVELGHDVMRNFARGTLATRLVAALNASTHVKTIYIQLYHFDDPEEDPSALLQFLQNGCHAKGWSRIILIGPSTAGLLIRFLQATQQNQDLQTELCLFDFLQLRLAHLKLLPSNTSMIDCRLANEDVALEEVEVALNANTTLARLTLYLCDSNIDRSIPQKLLRALHAHPSLVNLGLSLDDAVSVHRLSQSLVTLIRTSTGPLSHIVLYNCELNGHFLSDIATAVKDGGQRVTSFTFEECTFDKASFDSLKSIYKQVGSAAAEANEFALCLQDPLRLQQLRSCRARMMATKPGLIAVELYDTAVRDNNVTVREDDLTVCEDETFVNQLCGA